MLAVAGNYLPLPQYDYPYFSKHLNTDLYISPKTFFRSCLPRLRSYHSSLIVVIYTSLRLFTSLNRTILSTVRPPLFQNVKITYGMTYSELEKDSQDRMRKDKELKSPRRKVIHSQTIMSDNEYYIRENHGQLFR